MNSLLLNEFKVHPSVVMSDYDDFGYQAEDYTVEQRRRHAEQVIQRFFVGHAKIDNLEYESIAREINPGINFTERLQQALELNGDGFGVELEPPSKMVEEAFYKYAQTELGAVVLARLLDWDNEFIAKGWREPGGALTEAGICAYGESKWRPFRVASNGDDPDTVTPSGVLVLPDLFDDELYTTGDVSHPLAVIHHEIKAHVLPLKEAQGLEPGREMELICVRLESEMLRELGLPERTLNWGKDDGFLNHTLHEASEKYYFGLVRLDEHGSLVEVDPDTDQVVGPARFKK